MRAYVLAMALLSPLLSISVAVRNEHGTASIQGKLESVLAAPGKLTSKEASQESIQELEKSLTNILDPMAPKVTWDVLWEDLGVKNARPRASSSGPALDSLLTCLNSNYLPTSLTWTSATNIDGQGLGQNLKTVAGWWSQQGVASNDVITLITSASFDRLQQLEAQCVAWAGPLSAVLFVGLVQDTPFPLNEENQAAVRQAVLQVSKFVSSMHSQNLTCQPSVLLTYEVYTEATTLMLYPVNLLRNYARLQARTPLVAMLDVDLLPSRTLYDRFVNPGSATALVKQGLQKTVYIIPAFEMSAKVGVETLSQTTWSEALVDAPNKDMMVKAMKKGLVNAFHVQRFATGHRLTNFTKWQWAVNDYKAEYEEHCEPWVIGPRFLMPWHDSRYRGFGFNKMQHVNNLFLDGFKFKVLHDSYAIHRPHEAVEAQRHFLQRILASRPGQERLSLRQHVEALYNEQARAGAAYKAVVSQTELSCRAKLPWWTSRRLRRLGGLEGM